MLRKTRALLVFWCLPWVAGAAGCVTLSPISRPGEEFAVEPTAEMTGEQWQSPGVPPPRDPSVPWYHRLPLDDAWRELSAPDNHNAALVTFKRAELERGYFAGKVLISEEELARARERLLQVRKVARLDDSDAAREMPRMPDGRDYPAMVVQIGSREALGEIRQLAIVEAVEPLFLPLGIGCALDPYTPIAADGDFFGNRIPWSFTHLGIVEAWNLYKQPNNAIYFPGAGIRIGVIDTGVFEDENQLTNMFASSGRPAALHHTVVAKTWDDCGHGTRIAGLATAPLETQTIEPRKIAGVAWGADLSTVKYNGGVVLGAGQATELVAAIKVAVADGARVINLALGTPFWSSFVADNIDTIYRTTQTIFVAAAGTFVKDVQFPAKMYQVLAVSIVKSKDPANPQAGYELYGGVGPESAYGPEVAFAAVNGDGGVPTTGGGNKGLVQLGGSSSGTAHLSGIIALVWGKDPTATRAQVIDRLRRSGSLKLIEGEKALTPGYSAKVGYGIPDAYVAAGGSRTASISGPSLVRPGTSYTLTVSTDGWLPTTVLWDTGQTTRSATFTAGLSGTVNHSVTVRNPIDFSTIGAQHAVTVGPSHKRVLYSEPAIVRFPPYPFKGGIYDVKVNGGVVMPVGCAVLTALGQRLDSSYNNFGPPLSYLSLATSGGFNIARPGGIAARSLDVDARVWHNGTHAIRVKVHYAVSEPDGVDCNVPGATVHGWYPA
jgi:hypothetical protein